MKILKNDTLYKLMAVLCPTVFPQLRILRLADSQAAGMDKLFFYVRKADVMLKDAMTALDGIQREQIYDEMVAEVRFFRKTNRNYNRK
jgi:hypothetical protein